MKVGDYISGRQTRFKDDKTNSDGTLLQKAKRKVQFSRSLEYWREFDKETGELSEVTDLKIKEVELTPHCKNVKTLDNTDRGNSGQNIAKTQSITEVIQAFQKRQDRRINALKQVPVEEKSSKDCEIERKQRVKLASTTSYSKQLHKRSVLCNVANSSTLDTGEKFLWNLRNESPHVQGYFTYSFSASLCMLTSFKTPPPLPLVCSKSKVYDERLLPSTFESASSYSSPKPGENGLPPVVGKLPTPYIVQLFD